MRVTPTLYLAALTLATAGGTGLWVLVVLAANGIVSWGIAGAAVGGSVTCYFLLSWWFERGLQKDYRGDITFARATAPTQMKPLCAKHYHSKKKSGRLPYGEWTLMGMRQD